jgi:hypothetical protein
MEAICWNGRVLNGESNRGEVRIAPTNQGTAENDDDDEDEEDWEMTLN